MATEEFVEVELKLLVNVGGYDPDDVLSALMERLKLNEREVARVKLLSAQSGSVEKWNRGE